MVDIDFTALAYRDRTLLRNGMALLAAAWRRLAARRRRPPPDIARWNLHHLRDIGVTPAERQYIACHGRLPPHRPRGGDATFVTPKRLSP
jgi:uncharacterized protein YjiS (DUF1127 family)